MNPFKWYEIQNGGTLRDSRETINGFPCRLILVNDGTTPLNEGQEEPTCGNTKDMGIFNFNNDKDNTDTFGFNSDVFPNCASYEVVANSDTSAGAFMSFKDYYIDYKANKTEYCCYIPISFFDKDVGDSLINNTEIWLDFYDSSFTKIGSANNSSIKIPDNSIYFAVKYKYFPITIDGINIKLSDVVAPEGTVQTPYIKEEEELSYYQQSFELRYPDSDDVGEDFGYLDVNGDNSMGLKRLIDWVDNSTDEEFVRDFEQYFLKDYVFRYYILVIVLGMVDNFGKNMMLDTADHKIWFPRFYDMDRRKMSK